jgi:hypothetical protein
MHIARELGRRFVGCDLMHGGDAGSNPPLRVMIESATMPPAEGQR